MSTVWDVSWTMLLSYCILPLSTLIGIEDSPTNESEKSRLIVVPDSRCSLPCSSVSARSSHSESLRYPVDDCLGASLEYFGNKTDIQNFRRTSRHCDCIFEQYRIHQNSRFSNFGILFEIDSRPRKYRSIDHLLDVIPLVPDVYVGSNESDILYLFDLHLLSRQYVLRGLITRWNHPFISVLLWNDEDWRHNPILLLCIFAENGIKVAIFEQNVGVNRTISVFHQPNFTVIQLNKLLHRKHIRLLHPVSYWTLWTIGKRWCDLQLRHQWFVSGIGFLLISVASFIIYLSALLIDK